MKIFLTGFSLYMMYATFKMAHAAWTDNMKFASVFIGFMAVCFPLLLALLLQK